jgi:hypothetical protein
MLTVLIVLGVVVGMFALGAVVLGIFALFGGGHHGRAGENYWDAGSSGGHGGCGGGSFDGGGSSCGGGGCGGGGGD